MVLSNQNDSPIPTDLFLQILTTAPFTYPALAKLRLVSKSFCETIDTSPKLRAARLHCLVLTEVPSEYSYEMLKGLRTVSRSFKSLIDTSPKLASTLFREKVGGKVKAIQLKMHPVLDGRAELCAKSIKDIAICDYETDKEYRIVKYDSVMKEKACSPPVTKIKISEYGGRPSKTVTNTQGVTVLQVLETMVAVCGRRRNGNTDHCFFEGWDKAYSSKTNTLELEPMFGS